MPILDSHCHLASSELIPDLPDVIARAREAGVEQALCVIESEDEAEVGRVEIVREAWPGVLFATGIHPHNAGRFASDLPKAMDLVRRAIKTTGASALGEIGLDYHYDYSRPDQQRTVFRAQIRLARELDLPIVIHSREAADDTFRVLRDEGGDAIRGVFHCFTGDQRMAKQAVDLGFYISFAGVVTFPRANDLRETARLTPIDRLLSETDSPYLAPAPYRGKRNEPAFVVHVVDALAKQHGLTRPAMAEQIHANFQRLFGLAR